jgi:GT2 family glycosyltransferase
LIGVVVIGRNEGERLRACLASLSGLDAPVVYVDSGSTDGSPGLAASFGARVVRLDPAEGFTAARGRNAGFAALASTGAPPRWVQFIDGDCILLPGWIEAATARLGSDSKLAVVAGRRRERAPEASIFNRLCDMEWNTPVGPAEAVGGDALYRADAFAAAGGFDGTLICGEEPELCLRLRRRGWRIERLDADMTLHDAAMTRWRQWFRRTVRGGWAFAEGASMHGAGPERYGRRALRSIFLWGAAVPAAALGAGVAAAVAGAPPAAILLTAVVPLSAWPAMALRIALRRRASHGDPWRHALLYGATTMLGKIPELIGVLRHAAHRRRGGRAALIEYKAPGGAEC